VFLKKREKAYYSGLVRFFFQIERWTIGRREASIEHMDILFVDQ
jgi:hypothetical protein